MTTSRKKTALRPFYLQHTFSEVVFTTRVQAESLEEATAKGRDMNVSDVLDSDPEWIDGRTAVTGVFEN